MKFIKEGEKMPWWRPWYLFEECFFQWTMWGLGWTFKDGRGWDHDEIVIYIGPLRIVFLGNVGGP